ncbi:MAG: exodeoxyribonuclease VII large subunit [Geobacter sp.]|nr:exodeoxyribonuclease VII large subunit [Geobacter sp.]
MDLFVDKRILTISQLTRLVRELLEENFDHVWVEGEISNMAMPSSGHLYFTLKDAGAQLRCVMFRASARALRFRPADGMALVVRGRLSVYDQRGDYQLIVEYCEPKGLGALQLAFQQLKEKLAKEGLFDEAHKKPLPLLPQRIGIVTSSTGAAIHDMLNVLKRRFANVEVLLYPVRVQGDGAAEEIAAAIRDFNRYKEIDVMIVGRGGGSLEDLWAFNEEVVARAIYSSRIPVISAVGHEVDFTIADFVADLRAPTPSAAAELVLRSKVELENEVTALSHRLVQAVQNRLRSLRSDTAALSRALRDPKMLLGYLSQRVDDLSGRLVAALRGKVGRHADRLDSLQTRLHLKHPALELERCRERVIVLQAQVESAFHRNLDRKREVLAINGSKLQALSPLDTLSRGYSIVRLLPGLSVVTDGTGLGQGDRLELKFRRGGALCKVEEVKKEIGE